LGDQSQTQNSKKSVEVPLKAKEPAAIVLINNDFAT
jgi:hypothetical protein